MLTISIEQTAGKRFCLRHHAGICETTTLITLRHIKNCARVNYMSYVRMKPNKLNYCYTLLRNIFLLVINSVSNGHDWKSFTIWKRFVWFHIIFCFRFIQASKCDCRSEQARPMFCLGNPFKRSLCCLQLYSIYVPVSYTHLDVYKRQYKYPHYNIYTV